MRLQSCIDRWLGAGLRTRTLDDTAPHGNPWPPPSVKYDTSNLSPFTGSALYNQLVSGWLLCCPILLAGGTKKLVMKGDGSSRFRPSAESHTVRLEVAPIQAVPRRVHSHMHLARAV
jgi:hypothetical protein